MNKTLLRHLGIYFPLVILGMQEAMAQSVSATIKISLNPFLSIAILSEKKEQNTDVQLQNYTPLEITAIGPYQMEVISIDDQKFSRIAITEIPNNSRTMIITRQCSSARDQKVYSNKTISKMGGRFKIGLVDNTGAKKPLIISVTSL